jgi:FkbM family methyltransferase
MLQHLGRTIDQTATIKCNNSSLSILVPNEMTLWRVNSFWDKEPNTLRWIETFKPDDLFIDIGANIGLYSLYAAFSRGVEVIAFEPESLNYALLNKNIFLNRIDHKVKAYPLALSNEIAFNAIHVSLFMEGAACHNFKEKLDFKQECFRPEFSQGCFSVTLDYLTQQKFIPIPQHIKIDVDGIEHKILEGATQTLKDPLLESILVELNTNLPSHRQIIELMKENGFIYSQKQVEQEPNEGPFQGVVNYIFFKEPKTEWERHFSYASQG